ncbi:prepilin-type N-terminal cleavage/methylation domain-containing protein [Bacillus sp. JJ664]
MLKKLFKNEKGLTLVELLAVIVILGIIAGIAVPSVMKIIQKSRINAVKADALQIISAAKTYVASNPDDSEVTQTELADYVNTTKIADTYKVAVSNDGKSFKLTADAVSGAVSGVTISIDNATAEDINGSTDYDSAVQIGTPTP